MNALAEITGLVAAVLFIVGIKYMTRVKTARRGNQIAAVGMLLAVLATLFVMYIGDPVHGILPNRIGWEFIVAGIVVGGVLGTVLAQRIKMTAMPEMVALLNGFGGAASALVVVSSFLQPAGLPTDLMTLVTSVLGMLIGAVTFTGSVVACLKLRNRIKGRYTASRLWRTVTGLFMVMTLLSALALVVPQEFVSSPVALFMLLLSSSLLGIFMVASIGGADMPIVISLLNSYSGIAASMAGFALGNTLLVISGALVGASGIILSRIMCRSMNRTLTNVLFGGVGTSGEKKNHDYNGVKEVHAEEAALLFDSAESVIIVPGYGMAVGQAQHAVEQLMRKLEERGVKVSFAIHPVAGRMPGHMNVLLAEANIPYEKVHDIDTANGNFKRTSIAYVIGANDVVNPAATKDSSSPMYGMPILNAHEAQTVIIVKRSLSPGFAGVKNELFEYENAVMLYDDAKRATEMIVKELSEL